MQTLQKFWLAMLLSEIFRREVAQKCEFMLWEKRKKGRSANDHKDDLSSQH